MKLLPIIVTLCLVFTNSFVTAQDSIRITIGSVYSRTGPELIDVPVYVSSLDSFYAFQFNILYDTSVVKLQTVLTGEEIEPFGNVLFSEREPGRIRIIFNVLQSDPIFVENEMVLLNLRFLVDDKAVGIFPISFGNDIPAEVTVSTDGSNNPLILTNGNIVLGSDKLQLAVPDSLAFGATEPVCLPLIGNYIPALAGGRLVFEWDSTRLQATETRLNANPLGLTMEMITLSAGQLIIDKPIISGDTTPLQPLFTEILEICFLPKVIPGGSRILLNADSSSYFSPSADTLRKIDLLYFPGALSFQDLGSLDTVEFTVQGRTIATAEEGLCLPIVVNRYLDLSDVTIDLTWDVTSQFNLPLEFTEINDLNPLIDPVSFRYNIPYPNDPRARDVVRVQWNSLPALTESIPIGDTLFQVCFTSPRSCGVINLSASQVRAESAFLRRDSFVDRLFALPFHINPGQLLFGVDSVALKIEDAHFGGGPGEFPVAVTSLRTTTFTEGHLQLKFSRDSLELVSARILDGPAGANVFPESDQREGANLRLTVGNGQQLHTWEAGTWVELVFRPLVRPISTRISFENSSQPDNRPFYARKNNDLTFLPASLEGGSLTVDSPTGVAPQPSFADDLKIYPNPASGGEPLFLSSGELAGTTALVELSNQAGQLIGNYRVNFDRAGDSRLTLPNLPAGNYLLLFVASGGKAVKKLVIH